MHLVRDQLESFEMERRALLAQNEVAEGEAKKLAVQNGRLLGHQVHWWCYLKEIVLLYMQVTHQVWYVNKGNYLEDLPFLYVSFPPEPLSEDSACGENQAGKYATEDWGIVQKCISWKENSLFVFCTVHHYISGKPLNMLW